KNIQGLFEKSQAFYDSQKKTPDVGGTPGNKVIPMYETRPEMINQDNFYGSDYFFKEIGYQPEQPVIVIGDNYFISELIRRQVTESVGNYYQVKHNVEGADMVKMLVDNAGEVIESGIITGLEVGKKLTKEQIEALDRDIVWFVTEQVDGVDVLIPHVYLAKSSLHDIEQDSVTGAAKINANGDVNVAASEINNNNAVISAGNNANLTAENNINSISSGMESGIVAGNDVKLHSKNGDITNSGSQIAAGNNVSITADEGNVDLIASVGRDNEGKQQIGAYGDGITAGNNIEIEGKEINVTAVDLTSTGSADSHIKLKSTEGNVNFNDVHEVSSSYDSTFEETGFMSTRSTETITADAVAKTAGVNTSGKFIVDAKEDAVFHGGDYNSGSGSIKAGNDVITTTSQDHHMKQTKVTETSFELGFSSNVPGMDKTEVKLNSLDGASENHNMVYESAGSNSSLSNTNGKRPGAAPTAGVGGFHAGFKTTTTTTKDSSTKNKNANFNFANDAEISAGNTLDIGGMDLSVGEESTANISADNIISTKYKDVETHEESFKEIFTGIKGEAHSSVVDAAGKYANIGKKAEQEGMSVDAGMTAAQVAGDVSNLVLNDAAGGSVSIGRSETTEDKKSTTTKENINNINGGTINISSSNDTTLKGVEITASEVNVDTGGDFSLSAAESTQSEKTTGSTFNLGVSIGMGAGLTGAGAGASLDYSGSNSRSSNESTSYTNSTITAGNVTIKSGNDVNLSGANIVAGTADLDVAGDLSITSVQDHSKSTASSENWGASVGIAISTSGVLPTASAHGGGGSEKHTNDTVAQQSGIHTAGELTVKTGGDINLAGSHIISDSKEGSVNAGGEINVSDITDVVDSGGLYGGGGGGMSYKGTPMVNGYVDKLDTIYREEEQHSTINVGIKQGEVNGKLNTDTDKLSTVTVDEKTAGNNISFTVGLVKVPGSKKKGEAHLDTPTSDVHAPNKSGRPSKSIDVDGPMPAPANSGPGKPNNAVKPSTAVPDGPGKPAPAPAPSKPAASAIEKNKPATDHAISESVPVNKPSHTQPKPKPTPNKPSADVVDGPGAPTPTPKPNKPSADGADGPGAPMPTPKPNKPSADVVDGPGAPMPKPTPKPNKPLADGADGPGAPTPTPTPKPKPTPKPVDPKKPAVKWPTITPNEPIISSPGGSSAMGGFNGPGSVKPATNVPGGGTHSDITHATQPGKASGGTTAPAKKWPPVPLPKPITTSPGSSSAVSGFSGQGSVKPVSGAPGGGTRSDVTKPVPKAAPSNNHQAKANVSALGTTPGVAGVFYLNPVNHSYAPKAVWPAVQNSFPATDSIIA
ncbi:MAG: hemagglutinin repeat-containing protein, partial [Pantoea sp.]|nr:hemagglutinin repeat-containing protein [Pantoea sp.]